tara:strand:+ start:1405 stop:1701 length:297 start_codon:yes stop_codon:yes gene_type:complete
VQKLGMFFARFQYLTGPFITPISAIPDILCHVLEAPRCLVKAFARTYIRSPVSETPPAGMSYVWRIVPTSWHDFCKLSTDFNTLTFGYIEERLNEKRI